MAIEKAVVIHGQTRLETLKKKLNTVAQAKFYVQRSGGDFDEYEEEQEHFDSNISRVVREMSTLLKTKTMKREFVTNYIFSPSELVVVVGQDGLVANVAKYVDGLPIVAVNSDPTRFDGVLLPFKPNNAMEGVTRVMHGQYQCKEITMAMAETNAGQKLLAFNDLFIGPRTHTSARYQVTYNNKSEAQSSSGVIVSTGAGSTGWMSSVFNMANGVVKITGTQAAINPTTLPWDTDRLLFAVREPFVSKTSKAEITAGYIDLRQKLVLESRMPSQGVIFSDGMEQDYIDFNSGTTVTISVAPERARLVI